MMPSAQEEKLFKQIISVAQKQFFSEDILALENVEESQWTEINLGDEDCHALARKIMALSEQARCALLGIYYFRLSAGDIAVFYGVDHSEGIALFYRKLLSRSMGLNEKNIISRQTIYNACEIVMRNEAGEEKPEKSVSVKHTNRNKKKLLRIIMSAAAVIIAFFFIGMTTSAKLRAWVTKWTITFHEQYGEFTPASDRNDLTVEDARSYYPSYIPGYYRPEMEYRQPYGITYVYVNLAGFYLSVDISLPNHTVNLNTENAVIENTTFNGEAAFFILPRDGFNIFVFVIDGYPSHISGRLPKEELLKIAEGIKRR